jgi:flagellar basal-body rod protein FlgF
MDKMLYISMTGAKNIMLQQATTAHNLANVHTAGYKQDFVVFRALPVVGPGAPTRVSVTDNTVGHDLRPGSLNFTGNPLDFALASEGVLAVAADNGEEAYTRQGSVVVGFDGVLRNNAGRILLSDGGAPITVPTNAVLTIQSDGSILVQQAGEGNLRQEAVGKLKIINPDPKSLYKGPDGLFRVSNDFVAQNPRVAPRTPARVVASYIENSNVNAAEAMVQMINHARQFDLNIKVMQTADQNARNATQLLSITPN